MREQNPECATTTLFYTNKNLPYSNIEIVACDTASYTHINVDVSSWAMHTNLFVIYLPRYSWQPLHSHSNTVYLHFVVQSIASWQTIYLPDAQTKCYHSFFARFLILCHLWVDAICCCWRWGTSIAPMMMVVKQQQQQQQETQISNGKVLIKKVNTRKKREKKWTSHRNDKNTLRGERERQKKITNANVTFLQNSILHQFEPIRTERMNWSCFFEVKQT